MSVSTPRVVAKEDYTVGWVCAIPVEMASARGMLDEIHARLPEQDPADHNAYTLGQIQSHNVVIACLPSGMTGTTSAATVAKDMLRTFKSIRFGLMVGIGGGAPSSEHDIRLGDIVVSRPSGTSGGVIQYDRGKALQGEFLRTGSLNAPPKVLLAALASLQADHLVGETRIPKLLSKFTERNAKTRKTFGYPDDSNDCLFQAGYQHEIESASTCHRCDRAHLVQREARDDTGPVVHYGNIASGNQVVKNGTLRDRLQKEHDVLCFEMEAAGLMLDFPCIVIRGISDYADSHKNDLWQGYAAATAAGFAKELLMAISPAQVEKEKAVPQLVSDPELHERISQVNESIKTEAHNQQTRYEDDKHIACHQVFKTSAYESFKDINPDRVHGTCMWVLDHRQYKRWQQSSHGDLLWISADPGCGKSVLARFLVDKELSSTSEHTACYFFFKNSAGQVSLATALCALLHQLFSSQPWLLRHAMGAYEKNGGHLQHEKDELWRILLAAVEDERAQAVTCVLDALDECSDDDRPKLIQLLTDFYTQNARSSTDEARLKFLVTSRAYRDIEYGFSGVPRELPSIRLAGEHSNTDITREVSLVIKQKVAELAHSLRLDEEVQDALLEKLQATPHRTYLWLHLVIQELPRSSKRTRAAMMKIIERLPESVEEAYENILKKSKGKKRKDAFILLHIVVAAIRPLTLSEMDIAFQLATDSKDVKNHKGLDLDNNHLESRIRDLCGLFVFVNNNRIYLIHQTAKEFLVENELYSCSIDGSWKGSLHTRLSNEIMTRICVKYLSFDDIKYKYTEVRNSIIHTSQWMKGWLQCHPSHPFLEYSATHWPVHVSSADVVDENLLLQITECLYNDSSLRFQSLASVIWASASPYSDQPGFRGIHLAAFNGHTSVLNQLLRTHRHDVDVRDDNGETALVLASSHGHTQTVERLVAEGADVNNASAYSVNALSAAIKAGHKRTVEVLLNMGAGIYASSFSDAIENYHDNILKLLIENGTAVNDLDFRSGQTPLAIACRIGNNTAVRLLLESGADVDARAYGFKNSLVAACSNGHETVAHLLINGGAKFHNALQVAAGRGHRSIVKLLLDHGADMNPAKTSLLWEAKNHDEVFRMLLEHGASASILSLSDFKRRDVLETALRNVGHWEALRQSGFGMDFVDEEGQTLLYYALRSGCIEVVRSLLDMGANSNMKANNGRTPLHEVAKYGDINKLCLIHDNGAALQVADRNGTTPIHVACHQGHLNVVRYLHENGAALQVADRNGITPIHLASYKQHVGVVRYLLKNGATPLIADNDGQTPIFEATRAGHRELVELFLDFGADVNTLNWAGRTPLHEAVRWDHWTLNNFLLERGADPSIRDNDGRTPLDLGPQRRKMDITNLLQDTVRFSYYTWF